MERRLAAILAADVVGYSRLMEADEAGTLAALKSRRKNVLEPLIARHRGRIIKLMGDGVLVEYASAVNAVQCAVELQEAMAAANNCPPENLQIIWRVGINLGDVMVEGSDLYGDGVNIAARLEALAEPGSVYVSQTVFSHVRGKVKLDFEDLGEQSLKNMSEPVRVFKISGTAAPTVETMRSKAVQPLKPSIAVLPFVNMSGDPEQEFFVDGLTEDIISALSRISALRVIARTSTFTYKGMPTDVKRIATELGARYVMEGSARRAGDRLRVTAQLVDATTGHHLWAERYDRSLSDLFDIQDEITRSVTASTETRVILAEREAAESRPSTDFKARDLVARVNSRLFDWSLDWSPEALAKTSDLVEEAIRIDPSNPGAHQLRARVFLNRIYSGELQCDEANVARALELARTALRLAPRDEYAHWVMAGAYAEAGQLDDAVAECERGLEINPNSAIILQRLGACLGPLGRPQEAIQACRLALQLDPRNPQNYWRHCHIAIAHFVAMDYEAALQESKNVVRSLPHLPSAIIWAASAAALGKADEARAAVGKCLAQQPDLRVGRVPGIVTRFARGEDQGRLMTFLLKAGLPE
jgi:adenylate cyclase